MIETILLITILALQFYTLTQIVKGVEILAKNQQKIANALTRTLNDRNN